MMMKNLHFYGHCHLVVVGAYNKTHANAVFKRTKVGRGCAEITGRSQGL